MHSDKVRVRLLEAVWGWDGGDGGQVWWVGGWCGGELRMVQ